MCGLSDLHPDGWRESPFERCEPSGPEPLYFLLSSRGIGLQCFDIDALHRGAKGARYRAPRSSMYTVPVVIRPPKVVERDANLQMP